MISRLFTRTQWGSDKKSSANDKKTRKSPSNSELGVLLVTKNEAQARKWEKQIPVSVGELYKQRPDGSGPGRWVDGGRRGSLLWLADGLIFSRHCRFICLSSARRSDLEKG